jgi:hypothetical protein
MQCNASIQGPRQWKALKYRPRGPYMPCHATEFCGPCRRVTILTLGWNFHTRSLSFPEAIDNGPQAAGVLGTAK